MQHDETYHEWLTLGVSILTKHGMQQKFKKVIDKLKSVSILTKHGMQQ